MIIRSQDKKTITTDLNLTIFENDLTGEFEIAPNSIVAELGVYSTEEKAIKVLDMIQSAYQEANSVCTMSGFVANTTFQIPQDSEV